jgi:hypothetical protein
VSARDAFAALVVARYLGTSTRGARRWKGRDAVVATVLPDFREIAAQIAPHPDELRWQAIEWEVDLWEARRRAAEVGRPVFLWAMNGSPLGCT